MVAGGDARRSFSGDGRNPRARTSESQEAAMRHKGERDIPDFSAKKKEAHGVEADRKLSKAQHPARTAAPKPQSTSAKSGRRGQ